MIDKFHHGQKQRKTSHHFISRYVYNVLLQGICNMCAFGSYFLEWKKKVKILDFNRKYIEIE